MLRHYALPYGLIAAEPQRVGSMDFKHGLGARFSRGARNYKQQEGIFLDGSVYQPIEHWLDAALENADKNGIELPPPDMLIIKSDKSAFVNLDDWYPPSQSETDTNLSVASQANCYNGRLKSAEDALRFGLIVTTAGVCTEHPTRHPASCQQISSAPTTRLEAPYEEMCRDITRSWAWALKGARCLVRVAAKDNLRHRQPSLEDGVPQGLVQGMAQGANGVASLPGR